MDDADTSSWRQPNTFMDVIGPRPKKSNTLMRSAVKKPDFQAVPIQVNDIEQPAQQIEAPPTVIPNPRPDLAGSANLSDRSPIISRFSSNTTPLNDFVSQPISIEATAEDNLAGMTNQSMDGEASNYEPAPEQQVTTPDSTELTADLPELNIFKNLPSLEMVEHTAAKTFRWSNIKRLSGWTVLAIAVIGIVGGGIIINRNLSTLELYLASSRAGFSATLPSAKPSGYSLSGISTSAGIIEASYKSNSDSRSYSISEKKSSISSSALLSGYVTNQAGSNYQTITTDGLSVYLYNGHDATWVSNGIWYIVQDNNSLSDHQIIDIADSM